MGQSFLGLALGPSAGSLRDPGLTTHLSPGPCAVLTPGGTEAGEGTKLEDNGIRGFVLWILGGGGWTESHTPFSCPSLPLLPLPCYFPGASFLVVEGMGKRSAGPASMGHGGSEWQLDRSISQGKGQKLGGGAGPQPPRLPRTPARSRASALSHKQMGRERERQK